jgi:hypothetical protein
MSTIVMLRVSMTVALAFLSTVAVAQHNDEIKGVKFGTGCQEPIKPMAVGLGACTLSSSKIRMWCPNGKIFDRNGPLLTSAVVRSICGLNQVL